MRASTAVASALVLACAAACATAARPNIIFIITDDQDAVHGGDWYQPKLKSFIADQGFNFTQYVVNFALCCPSRASTLVGMCAHNSRIVHNADNSIGGLEGFLEMGHTDRMAHTVMQDGGYRTGLIGKFLNGYTNPAYIPPGVDRWFAMMEPQRYYTWSASDQGQFRRFGAVGGGPPPEEEYSTDVLAVEAEQFIYEADSDSRPFFLYLAPFAPHAPYLPAPRHVGALKGLKMPRSPAFNESVRAISKKVSFIKRMPPVPKAWDDAYDFVYQSRAETMLAVDDMIERVVQALEIVGQLDNTYIFYASDNGYKLGHRRMVSGKQGPYEEDVRVPMYVRTPGSKQGVQLSHLVSNIDLLPTWVDLAGVSDPFADQRDGISFAPLLRGDQAALADPASHRTALIVEKLAAGGADVTVSTLVPVPANPIINDVFFGNLRVSRLADGTFPPQAVQYERNVINSFVNSRYRNFMGSAFVPNEALIEDQQGFQQLLIFGAANNVSSESLLRTYSGFFPGPYYAMRTLHYKFIQWPEGFELYDLRKDPFEVDNIYYSTAPAIQKNLRDALNQLKTCKGRDCRVTRDVVTNAPPSPKPPPPAQAARSPPPPPPTRASPPPPRSSSPPPPSPPVARAASVFAATGAMKFVGFDGVEAKFPGVAGATQDLVASTLRGYTLVSKLALGTKAPRFAVVRTAELRTDNDRPVAVRLVPPSATMRTWRMNVTAAGRPVAVSTVMPGGTFISVTRFNQPTDGVKTVVLIDAGSIRLTFTQPFNKADGPADFMNLGITLVGPQDRTIRGVLSGSYRKAIAKSASG